MNRQAHQLDSAPMGRKVFLWQYGHFGLPVLAFPSAAGMAHEWEAHGMIDALADLIDGGRIKLYCVESNVAEAWTRRDADPAWRIGRHRAYERFVLDELLPFIRHDCRSESIPVAVTGTSLGAFYAANFALKRPETFRFALCMSGRYDISDFAGGLHNDDVYFNNPMWYVSNMEGEALEHVRRHAYLTLVCGRGAWEDGNHQETARFAGVLAHKAIPHQCDLWGTDVSHEWPWWRKQARHHLGLVYGR